MFTPKSPEFKEFFDTIRVNDIMNFRRSRSVAPSLDNCVNVFDSWLVKEQGLIYSFDPREENDDLYGIAIAKRHFWVQWHRVLYRFDELQDAEKFLWLKLFITEVINPLDVNSEYKAATYSLEEN